MNVQPPAPPTSPPSTSAPVTYQPARRGPWVGGFILIALGVVFLASNVFPLGGGAVLLGLGLAFLAARILTGRYGFAVPAGILLGLGAFIAWREATFGVPGFQAADESGWVLLLLGLGFLVIYVIGARPTVIWPLFPAAVLIAIGLGMLNLVDLQPLAQLSWLVNYWPVALIAIGLWVLARDRVPTGIGRAVGVAGVVLLLAYGTLAGAASIAAARSDFNVEGITMVGPGMVGGTAPYTQTVERTLPINPNATFHAINPNGQTTIRAADGTDVHVTAVERSWTSGRLPSFTLAPDGDGVTLQTEPSSISWFGFAPRIDFVIDLPPTVAIQANSTSGEVTITGISGPVHANASSGSVSLINLGGPVTVNSSSGDVHITNVGGDLIARSSSGTITATGVAHPREVSTSSGDVSLAGVFGDATRIQSGSGDVTLRFDPSSSARVAVTTGSGNTTVRDLSLSNQVQSGGGLTGTVGSGGGTLDVHTGSGDVLLTSAR